MIYVILYQKYLDGVYDVDHIQVVIWISIMIFKMSPSFIQ